MINNSGESVWSIFNRIKLAEKQKLEHTENINKVHETQYVLNSRKQPTPLSYQVSTAVRSRRIQVAALLEK